MINYRLKPGQPAFEAVDGRLVGRRFEPGKAYAEVPAGCQDRFEQVEARPDQADQAEQADLSAQFVKKPGKRQAGGDA